MIIIGLVTPAFISVFIFDLVEQMAKLNLISGWTYQVKKDQVGKYLSPIFSNKNLHPRLI